MCTTTVLRDRVKSRDGLPENTVFPLNAVTNSRVFETVSTSQYHKMHVGKRVGTVFGVGASRVVRADVIVSRVDAQRRTVHVIAQDGEEYGPIAIPKLKAPRCEEEESHAALLEAWVTNRVEDYAARRITQAVRDAHAEGEQFGVEEGTVPTYQEEYHDHECTYCGTTTTTRVDSDSALCCGTVLCADCTSNYVSTLFERPPTSDAVPCPCACGSTLPWSHVARSVPDAVMTRLVRLYAPPPAPPPAAASSSPHSALDDCLHSLEVVARRHLEEASNLCAPCCGSVIDDFDGCFAVACRACPTTYFCAWCLAYASGDDERCHQHVRECTENPHPGAVYGDMHYWLDTHRSRKRKWSLGDAYGDVHARASHVLARAHDALV